MAVKNGWTSLAPRRTEQSRTPRGSQLRWCHLGSLETGPPAPHFPGKFSPTTLMPPMQRVPTSQEFVMVHTIVFVFCTLLNLYKAAFPLVRDEQSRVK